MDDLREHAPAAERNKEPILGVLRRILPKNGLVLEIASGTGQHVAWFAAHLTGLYWQPSEVERDRHGSIAAWTKDMANVRPPLALNMLEDDWSTGVADAPDAIFNSNMVHIAPWAVCEGLMRGAGTLLAEGAPLVLYGPFRREGSHTSQSNAEFDFSLRSRDPSWGVRDLETVAACADLNGFDLEEIAEMPANNLILVFRRRAPEAD
jgi:hypothetical protein